MPTHDNRAYDKPVRTPEQDTRVGALLREYDVATQAALDAEVALAKLGVKVKLTGRPVLSGFDGWAG